MGGGMLRRIDHTHFLSFPTLLLYHMLFLTLHREPCEVFIVCREFEMKQVQRIGLEIYAMLYINYISKLWKNTTDKHLKSLF